MLHEFGDGRPGVLCAAKAAAIYVRSVRPVLSKWRMSMRAFYGSIGEAVRKIAGLWDVTQDVSAASANDNTRGWYCESVRIHSAGPVHRVGSEGANQ